MAQTANQREDRVSSPSATPSTTLVTNKPNPAKPTPKTPAPKKPVPVAPTPTEQVVKDVIPLLLS